MDLPNRRRRAMLGLLTSMALVVWTEPRQAQDEDGGEPAPPVVRTGFGDEITVRARPLQQIEERARETERQSVPILETAPADELGRFPDRDAAGAAQRLPGVTVIRDQGDARLVLVRGFLPAQNTVTLDGERLPAGEADERAVALDIVPTELLEAVEVSKTLTSALDGDALGGAVNLVTRRPPRDRDTVFGVSLGTGHDDGSDSERTLAAATLGGWSAARRLGMSLSASHLEGERGVDSVEREWEEVEEGFEMAEERLQDHTSDRRRLGLGASVEWRPGASTTALLRGLWTEFEDLERRRARVLVTDGGARLSELKDRRESQTLTAVSASGQLRLGEWLAEPGLWWSRGDEEEPDRLDTIFASEESDLPEDYELEAFRTESDRSSNEDLVARLDLRRELPIGSAGRSWVLRTGAKWRHKEARRDDNLLVLEPEDDQQAIRLADIADPGWSPADPFFGGGTDLGPFAEPDGARDLLRRLQQSGGVAAERDPEEDLGDFEAEEDVAAAYVLLEGALTDRVSMLGGVRIEATETSYAARELLLDEDGEVAATTPVVGGDSYDEILPSVILRTASSERDVLRLALTRGLARPNLADLTPARLVVPEDEEILAGNPRLVPTTAWNLDVQWQRDLGLPASASLALYHKQLSDVIAVVRRPAVGNAEGEDSFTLVQPRNAGDAEVTGLELSWRGRLRDGPLRGLGLAANLTWADSQADLEGRGASRLPGQADVSGSLVLSFERPRLSVRGLYSYRDQILEELGDSPDLDLYLEGRGQLDVSCQVRAWRRWSFFAEAFNLTREDVRRFEGTPARPVMEERIGWWATFGIRFDS